MRLVNIKKCLPCKSAKRMRLNVKKQIKLVMDNIKQTHLFPSQRFENPNVVIFGSRIVAGISSANG